MMKKTDDDIGFVLLHGAGLGAWIWEKLTAELEYPTLAVDYPGRGKRSGNGTAGLHLSDYVASALADLDGFRPRKLVVVAHSIGGVIGLEIERQRRERAAGFAAVGAAVPARRGSYASSLPLGSNLFLRLMLAFSGTRPPDAAIRDGLCNDLDDKRAAEVSGRFVPESKGLYTDRTADGDRPENSLYIRLTRDRAIVPALQDRMISRLKAKRVREIDSGHLPMLSRPAELARILNDYASSLLA